MPSPRCSVNRCNRHKVIGKLCAHHTLEDPLLTDRERTALQAVIDAERSLCTIDTRYSPYREMSERQFLSEKRQGQIRLRTAREAARQQSKLDAETSSARERLEGAVTARETASQTDRDRLRTDPNANRLRDMLRPRTFTYDHASPETILDAIDSVPVELRRRALGLPANEDPFRPVANGIVAEFGYEGSIGIIAWIYGVTDSRLRQIERHAMQRLKAMAGIRKAHYELAHEPEAWQHDGRSTAGGLGDE